MKNILVSFLLVSSLCSFTKKKKKPEVPFKKGDITAMVGAGWPHSYGWRSHGDKLAGPFFAAGEWQASGRWSFGLNYYFNYVQRLSTYYATPGNVATPLFQYEDRRTYHAFMATAEYCYINRGRVCLGSGIGLGYIPQPTIKRSFPDGIDHSAQMRYDRSFALAIRLRLIDAKVRINKNWGVCGGFGYGSDGLLNVGATYTFNGRE